METISSALKEEYSAQTISYPSNRKQPKRPSQLSYRSDMLKTILRRTLVCAIVLVAPALNASHQKASAATITVTTGQDGAIGSVAGCSLREAVNAINTQGNGNGCANSS